MDSLPLRNSPFFDEKIVFEPPLMAGSSRELERGYGNYGIQIIVDFPPGRVTITWLGGSKCWFWPQHGAVTSCNRQTWFSKWDWQLRTPHVGKSKNNYIYMCVFYIIHFGPCYVHPRVLIQKWQSYPAPQKHILRQARGMIGAALTEAWERGSAKRDVKMGTDS